MRDTIARIKSGEVTRENDDYGMKGFYDLADSVIDINDHICVGDECDEVNAVCDLLWDMFEELNN